MSVPSLTGIPPLLVGRERELGVLGQHLDAALAGHGSLVLIGGEAGIGKTALAEALCRGAIAQGAFVLVGHCYDLAETPPYGPWIELLGQYRPADAMPPLPAIFAGRSPAGDVTSQAALFQQVRDCFVALAARHSLVLLLDDLQWADPASLDFLRFLARSLDALPILAFVTYRSDELTRRHPLSQLLPILVREAHAARLDLHTLDDAAVRALVAARYDLAEDDAHRVVAYVQSRAEGNAFYLGELLRSLEETGVLRHADMGWTLGDLTLATIPPLLRQVIDGRLTRLDDECQRLLALAAVIGHEVPLALWIAMNEEDEETILSVVEAGTQARLLVELSDGARVQFSHALVREAIYEDIPPVRRRRFHRRVGEALLAERQPDPGAVAYHFQRAGDARAVEWLLRAWRRAYRAYAWETAAIQAEAALALMEQQGADLKERAFFQLSFAALRRYTAPRESIALYDEAERLAVAAGDRALIYGARVGRGLLRCMLGDVAQGLAEMSAGVEQEESLTPQEHAPRRWVRGEPDVHWITNSRGTVMMWLALVGRYREAVAMTERFLALSAPHPEFRGASAHGDGLLGLGNAYLALGRVTEARDALRQAREIYVSVGHYNLLAQTASSELELILAYAADNLAERRRVAAVAEEALGRASGAVGDVPPALARVLLLGIEGQWAEIRALIEHRGNSAVRPNARVRLAGALAILQGDTVQAWDSVRTLLPDGLATKPGTRQFAAALGTQRLAVRLSLDAGDLPQARAWLDAQQAWVDWSGLVLGLSEGDALWAQYYRQAGEADKAFAHAEQALAHATEPRQPLALLAAHRLCGELATDAGQFDDARTHLDASLALADACAAPFERALALLALAALHTATGKRTEAATLLDEVRTVCTPLEARPTLDRADTLAARLAATTDTPPANPAGLSDREVEVLRLVAAGLTNAQVADRLFLSPHTINAHLTTIYAKLDVPSRAAAIRFALDHGLR